VVGEQQFPDGELPVYVEIDNAYVQGGAQIVEVQMDGIEVEVVQMDQVLMNDGNFEVIRVQMNNENVEIIEVQMDEVLLDDVEEVPVQVEVVAPDHNEEVELEIDILPQRVNEEVSKYFFILI